MTNPEGTLGLLVNLQEELGNVCLTALATYEGSFATVVSLVNDQSTPLSESLAAQIAPERLGSGVGDAVYRQESLAVESLAAIVAGKGLVTSVLGPGVNVQALYGFELLATVGAQVGALRARGTLGSGTTSATLALHVILDALLWDDLLFDWFWNWVENWTLYHLH